MSKHSLSTDGALAGAAEAHVSKKLKRSATPLEELSEGGLLTQEDVVYYQKEAIYRKLNLIRRKNVRLKKELAQMSGRYQSLRKYYSVVNNWWSQVLDNFHNFDLVAKAESGDGSEFNQHLLISIPEDGEEAKDEKLEKELAEKRSRLVSVLQPLLSQPVENREEKVVDLEESLTNLNVFKSRLEDENKVLKEKIEDLNLDLDKYISAVEKKKSKALDRISDNLHDREEVKQEAHQQQSPQDTATANGSEAKPEDSAAPDSEALAASQKEVEDLKISLAALKKENETISAQLNTKSEATEALEGQLTDARAHLLSLNEQDLQKSPEYQALLAKNSELFSQLSQTKFDGSKTESQFYELESKQTAYSEKLHETLQAELNNNTTYVKKLESDLNRIRADRDNLQAKVNTLSAEKGKSELVQHYQKLTETLSTRLAELEQKEKSVQEGSAHNQTLERELEQMEKVFKSTREVASAKLAKYAEADSYINKLTVEKSKADEKYFQAMRTKDALSAQNKTQSLNLAKHAELIEALKANERKLLKKLEVEDSLFAKLKELETVYKNDLAFEKSKNKELDVKLKTVQGNHAELHSDLVNTQKKLAVKEKGVSSLESSQESLQTKVSELERLVEGYRSKTRTAEDEEINQALLTMTKCQLCNKNFKNVTLKSCGHCFCSECIHDRLSSRMRKCPNCNKQFSNYDLLAIHL